MNLQAKLDQFRDDNPFDADTQAKRLLAGGDKELILHVLALGLTTAKQRQRHQEREYIKTIGEAPQPREKIVPGRVTGSIRTIPIKASKRREKMVKELIFDIWHVGNQKLGDTNRNDLAVAITRETNSANGHSLNVKFYTAIRASLDKEETVREKWSEEAIRSKIEETYGEFRKFEAA